MWAKWAALGNLMMALGGACAQTQIRVESLLGDSVQANPAPVRVEFQQGGSVTEGTLILRRRFQAEERYPLQLPPNARKSLTLAVAKDAIALDWQPQEGRATPLELPYPIEEHVPIAIVGDVKGGLQVLSQIEAERRREETLYWRPVYWPPEALPTEWRALSGLRTIVLVDGAERLSESQWRALTTWMLTGGHLIVSLGGTLRLTLNATPLKPYLPPTGTPVKRVVIYNNHPSEYAIVPTTPPPSGWRVERDGEDIIFLSRPVFAGKLTFVLSDLTSPAWRNPWFASVRWQRWLSDIDTRAPAEQMQEMLNMETPRPVVITPRQLAGALTLMTLTPIGVAVIWHRLRSRGRLARATPWLVGWALVSTGTTLMAMPRETGQPRSQLYQIFLIDPALPVAARAVSVYFPVRPGVQTLTAPVDTRWEARPGHGVAAQVRYEDRPKIALRARGRSAAWFLSVEPAAPPVRAFWQGENLVLEATQGAFVSEAQPDSFTTFQPTTPKRRLMVPRSTLATARTVFVTMRGLPYSIEPTPEQEVAVACIAVP